MHITDNVWKILRCSYCDNELRQTSSGGACARCDLTYHYTESGSFDLRLRRAKQYSLEFTLGTNLPSSEGFQVEPLKTNLTPELDFSGIPTPRHLKKEMLSYFPKPQFSDSLMLDLGCGGALHKQVCEHAGFEWVGLDYDSTKATILGDAHSLPFKDNSIEFILSVATLEHIRFPFVMMREAFRVLKPRGKFIGTVAFLEPFHGNSFYHHTHLGTINSLTHAGFTIQKLAPSTEWSGLMAQASMALFPRLPRIVCQTIVAPIQILHRLWWAIGGLVKPSSNELTRITNTTGAFTFIATKHN